VIRPKTKSDAAKDKVEDIPSEVQSLLNKYKDIVVDDFPSSLPPMRATTIT